MEIKKYTVAPGDTLSSICKKIYGRFDDKILKQVMTENKINNPNRISVGQILLFATSEPNDNNTLLAQPAANPATNTNKFDISNDMLLKELPRENYILEETQKDMIVLHFTVSYDSTSPYETFLHQKTKGVATPFIVDKIGPKHIIKLFDEKYCSYHLGQNEFFNNWKNDKRSIGIEVVNIGPVWFQNGVWYDNYQKKSGKKSTPEQDIVKGENRDAQGAVKFPDEQIVATCNLINFLCDKWNIPREVPKDKTSFQLPKLNNFKGITSHMMFRRSGKYEMGPAWPWQRVIELCNLKEVELI